MSVTPKHNTTSDRALDLINSGEPLNDMFISGELNLTGHDNFDKALSADNCIFEHLKGISSSYLKTFKFTNCEFKNCEFLFSYFLGGLVIDNCIFDSYLDFQAGGHNKNGNAVSITNSTFKNFVNFFDCWYESELIIRNNNFQKGTNLLGKPNGISVTFDINPMIENNRGQLDIGGEGDLKINTINLQGKYYSDNNRFKHL